MKITRQLLLAATVSALACLGTRLDAQTPASATTKLSGAVTDGAGKPVAGATVEYWRHEGNLFQAGTPELGKKITTGADGEFEFEVPRGMGWLLAQKNGLAPAWKQLGLPFNQEPAPGTKFNLALTVPGTLAGVVVDETGKPVADAKVSVELAIAGISFQNGVGSINALVGKPASDLFSARTDGAGHFRISNFPTNASAIFAVHSPGKILPPVEPQFAGAGVESAGYRAEQADIKLAVEPAGGVEGKIVCGDTNRLLPVARLTLQSDSPGFLMSGGHEPVSSGKDGAFRFDDVAAGSYHVRATFGTNAAAEWVAEPAAVSVEAGQMARGVQLTAQRGALLEVSVVGKESRQPLAEVNITAFRPDAFQSTAVSDKHGLARLRLVPGDYQIAAFQQGLPSSQTAASVEAGKTNHVDIEIDAPKKISGIVRRSDGKPSAGVTVQLVGGFGPSGTEVKTDANGEFRLDWNQPRFPGQGDATACVLVRDAEHNLAAAQDIDEDTTNLELKLAPGLTLVGRAECNGKPITNATAQLVFWTGRSGSWLQGLARTNTPGQYEIPALPPGRKYGVIVSAPGYGQKQLFNFDVSDNPGRQELDPVELKPANLKLAGQVFDADDKPVAGCYVNLNGDGQPSGNARTDREGRFTFAHVCEGQLQVSASSQRSFGNISAEGGDTNVVLHLGQNMGYSPDAKAHKLRGVVTDADGRPADGVRVAVFPNNNGSRWFKTGTNGEYSLTWMLQSWQMQNGSAYLVVRDEARDLAAVEVLSEGTTNLDVKLKPALTLAGVVKSADNASLTGAHVGLWFKAGNNYEQLTPETAPVNAGGRFEIKCLPVDGEFIVWASANGYGKGQRQIQNDADTNRMELEPFVLKPADLVIAGQVLKDDDKPASGVNVNLNGDGQPDGYMTTDSKGRFHFKVCEGEIRLFAYSQSGGGNAQATVEAGDTNIVMNLSSNPGNLSQGPHRATLKGQPLPDLTTVNLSAAAAPAGKAVLLCLFNAGERPSRHVIHLLDQQAAALGQKNICVLGVQAALTSDDIFNGWKSGGAVFIPVGRLTEKSPKTKWVSDVTTLPWLILTDVSHRVVAEGFSLDDLDAQIQKLSK